MASHASKLKPTEKVWVDGQLVPFEKAQVHVLTHGLHYGTGVFEGVRCYDTEAKGPAIFRHRDHLERLRKSAELFGIGWERASSWPHT